MTLIILLVVHRKLKNAEKEKRVLEKMVRKFEQDDLTGVYTRKAFLHYAAELVQQKNKKEYGIAIVEILNYKISLNQYGDNLVNEYLIYLADHLKSHFPDGYIGRFSESKFALITEIDEKHTIDPQILLAP